MHYKGKIIWRKLLIDCLYIYISTVGVEINRRGSPRYLFKTMRYNRVLNNFLHVIICDCTLITATYISVKSKYPACLIIDCVNSSLLKLHKAS